MLQSSAINIMDPRPCGSFSNLPRLQVASPPDVGFFLHSKRILCVYICTPVHCSILIVTTFEPTTTAAAPNATDMMSEGIIIFIESSTVLCVTLNRCTILF